MAAKGSALSLEANTSSFTPENAFGNHVVQFYEQDSFLLDQLSRFVGTALGSGDSAVVIATKPHRDGLTQRLKSRGFDLSKLAARDRYIVLDAAETLSLLTVNGDPNEQRFVSTIGPGLARATAAAACASRYRQRSAAGQPE